VAVAPAPVVPAPVVPAQPVPAIQEQQQLPQTPPPPVINEQRGGNGNPPIRQDFFGPRPGALQRPGVNPLPAQPVAPAPAVRLDRITSTTDARLEGQVVRQDRAPQPGVRVLFVSAQRQAPNCTVTANSAGRFQVSLASGSWLVYVAGSDGRPVFHSRLDVSGSTPPPLTVVAR
jgi:hypothetical protein